MNINIGPNIIALPCRIEARGEMGGLILCDSTGEFIAITSSEAALYWIRDAVNRQYHEACEVAVELQDFVRGYLAHQSTDVPTQALTARLYRQAREAIGITDE